MALTGKLSETPFTDLIQFYAESRQTVAVTVSLPDGQGEDGVFYLEDGEVVDAFLGDAVGRDAIRRAMLLAEGTFRIEPDLHPAERTIAEPLHQLLLPEPMQGGEERRDRELPPPPSAAAAAAQAAGGVAGLDGVAHGSEVGAERPPAFAAPASAQTESRPSERGPLGQGAGGPRRWWLALIVPVAVALLLAAGGLYSRCVAPRSAHLPAPAPPAGSK